MKSVYSAVRTGALTKTVLAWSLNGQTINEADMKFDVTSLYIKAGKRSEIIGKSFYELLI